MDELKKPLIPVTAGILLILSGVLAIIVWILLFFNEQKIIFGIICCVLSIFPILAGILAIKRKLWTIVFLGAGIGLFTILTPLIIPSGILASIGFILIVISKKEFQ